MRSNETMDSYRRPAGNCNFTPEAVRRVICDRMVLLGAFEYRKGSLYSEICHVISFPIAWAYFNISCASRNFSRELQRADSRPRSRILKRICDIVILPPESWHSVSPKYRTIPAHCLWFREASRGFWYHICKALLEFTPGSLEAFHRSPLMNHWPTCYNRKMAINP